MSHHTTLSTKSIDVLNIGLIFLSLIIALKLPFELFLFSYAVLGPLHYLTEINWLKDRNFFIKSDRVWTLLFILFAAVLSLYPLITFISLGVNESIQALLSVITAEPNVLLLMAFFFGVCLMLFKKTWHLILAFLASVTIALLLNFYVPTSILFVGLFLPTLIHVYVFTLLFILYGAIKSKRNYGFFLALVLFTVPFIIYFIPVNFFNYQPSDNTLSIFESSQMNYVSTTLASFFTAGNVNDFNLLSEFGLRIQAFIAFAYTYHYLNWFSKTSVIGWKDSLNSKSTIAIGTLWVAAVGIYIYDYKVGLIALFFLSFLHVLLEFPLNGLTIKEVFRLRRKA